MVIASFTTWLKVAFGVKWVLDWSFVERPSIKQFFFLSSVSA